MYVEFIVLFLYVIVKCYWILSLRSRMTVANEGRVNTHFQDITGSFALLRMTMHGVRHDMTSSSSARREIVLAVNLD